MPTNRHPEFSLAALLEDPSYPFVVKDAEEREIAYVSPQYGTPVTKKVALLDPSTHTLYLAMLPRRTFAALGTATFFWDADKYALSDRHTVSSFEELRAAFEEQGFSFEAPIPPER